MNVEDNLDSDTFYDFWQLSGCDVVLCRNSGHISKITTDFFLIIPIIINQIVSNCLNKII